MRPHRHFIRNATRATLVVALLGALTLTCLASPPARLTIADGPVQVLRGAAKFDAAEGQALVAEDIVRTGDATRVARIEFADGRLLDLGPATQVLLLPPWDGAAGVLAQGWAKIGAGDEGVARLAAPQAWVEAGGSALVHANTDGALLVFAESRAARVLPRQPGVNVATLREGDAWTREAGVHRALPQRVPRALTDRLPRRAERFAGQDNAPEAPLPLEAADLGLWLRAEPGLLAQLRPRLAAMARRSAGAPLPAPRTQRTIATRQARPDPRKARAPVLAALQPSALAPMGTPIAAPLDSLGGAPTPAALFASLAVISLPALLPAPRAASTPTARAASVTRRLPQ
jgi:hypothetical protein